MVGHLAEAVCKVAGGEPTAIEVIGDFITLYQKDQRVETPLRLSCARNKQNS